MTLTSLTAPPTAAAASRRSGLASADLTEVRELAVALAPPLLACAWWLLVAPRLWGGRGAGAVTVGAALTAVAVMLVQPHRYLPARVISLAVAVSAAAMFVAALSPTGWAGAATAASYVCAAWTVVAVAAAVVREPRSIDAILLLIVVGVLVEFAEAWTAWWGGENPAAPMIGTFYWHDPFAAFLLPGTIVGFGLWLQRRGSAALVGMVALVLGSIGLVYSTSRAAIACAVLAAGGVAVAHVAATRLGGIRRLGTAVAATGVGVVGIAGPPFFPHRVTPLAGTAARGSGQSLAQNGGYRLDFWREALGVFQRHPATGGGYHSLATASVGHTPQGWPLSPLAHNGYLQALSDGGLVLAVPFLLAALAILGLVMRAIWRGVRDRDVSLAGFVVPLVLGAVLVHSAVDFDWSYAADFSLAAVLAGIVVGVHYRHLPVSVRRSRRTVMAAGVIAGVALLSLAATAAVAGDLQQSLPIHVAAVDGSGR